MADLREAALEELKALERSLEADPRYQKISLIKSLLALYDRQGFTASSASIYAGSAAGMTSGAAATSLASASLPHQEHTRNIASTGSGRRTSPDRERALMAAVDYISGRIGPTKTAEILSHLGRLGIPVGGTVPLSNLSAMLHHSPLFQTHGRLGWTLASDSLPESYPNGPQDGDEREKSLASEDTTDDVEEAF